MYKKAIILIVGMTASLSSYADWDYSTGFKRWVDNTPIPEFYIDSDPDYKYVTHDYQVCVKDQFKVKMDGKQTNVYKIKCRQANGKFKFIH